MQINVNLVPEQKLHIPSFMLSENFAGGCTSQINLVFMWSDWTDFIVAISPLLILLIYHFNNSLS